MDIPSNILMNIPRIKLKISAFIREQRVVTTSEIAAHLGVSWNTAEKYLLELTIDHAVVRVKKEGVNLWLMN